MKSDVVADAGWSYGPLPCGGLLGSRADHTTASPNFQLIRTCSSVVRAQRATFADLIGFRIAVHGVELRLKPDLVEV
jgi:hypothetical protein